MHRAPAGTCLASMAELGAVFVIMLCLSCVVLMHNK
jgi:hypothetical protein